MTRNTERQDSLPVHVDDTGGEHISLSSLYISAFDANTRSFRCCEQYFHAAKAALFEDDKGLAQIMAATDPNEYHNIGKSLVPHMGQEPIARTKPKDHQRVGDWTRAYLDHVWRKQAYNIMVTATHFKFTASEHAEELRALLLATGERQIIYTPPSDNTRRLEPHSGDEKANPESGVDQNRVGKALEQIRSELRNGTELDVKRRVEQEPQPFDWAKNSVPKLIEELKDRRKLPSSSGRKRKADLVKLRHDDDRAIKRAKREI